ncbi:unnamed protein product [Rangifer tarandus platyrhynchus]|uniref:Uncharacterized protein n=2 Tax=Rangifer tarandus platyrhynchus TaxID=3082113 RepID=A0ACB0EH77_RANTA|nr:unnamed protein product [Rangifer tarandus platyrhynchus]CAI9699898.1 unnamed protein product [Rangifer tarandus platyrhynchus]
MVLEEVPAPEHVSDGRREVKPVQCFPNRIHQEIHHVVNYRYGKRESSYQSVKNPFKTNISVRAYEEVERSISNFVLTSARQFR